MAVPRTRRVRFIAKVGAAALAAGLPITACSPPPYDPATARLFIIGTFTSSENRFALTSTVESVVDEAIATNAGEVVVLVMNNGRPVEIHRASLVLRRGGSDGKVENDPRRRVELAKQLKAELLAAITAAADTSGQLNAFGMYEVAAGISGPATVVFYSSFMQTVPPLATTNWDQVGRGAAEAAAEEGKAPSLPDKRVFNLGIADTGGEQARGQEPLVDRLVEQVEAFCEAADAASCVVERAYGEVRGTPSEVPIPIIPVPVEPVIFGPIETLDDGPIIVDQPSDLTFEPNSAVLLPGAANMIAEIARNLPAGAFLTLTGHTATYGPRESSLALSLSRCKAVLNEVIKYFPEDQVVCRGVGFDEPIVPDIGPDGSLNPDAAQRNRVVRYEIVRAEEAQ